LLIHKRDAWAKNKDLDPHEARRLYVEALLKVGLAPKCLPLFFTLQCQVLRKYSDRTIARTLIQELESYGGLSSSIVITRKCAVHHLVLLHITHFNIGNLTRSSESDDSGSTVSDPPSDISITQHQSEPSRNNKLTSQERSESEPNELPSIDIVNTGLGRRHSETRPQSSLSSPQYRTPLAGSLVMSPPSEHHVPLQQPLPRFEAPSAFAEATSIPSSLHPPSNHLAGPTHLYTRHPSYPSPILPHHPSQYDLVRPATALALERAVENVQVQLAALSERLETLESRSLLVSRSNISPSSRGSPLWVGGRGSPTDRDGVNKWDINEIGMWSFILNPLSDAKDTLRTCFARDENRSPSSVIIRRLCLDISFLLCVISVIGAIWRRSGSRRREVRAALIVLWRAIVGSPSRAMVDRGV
jgi:hypothetical protein